MDGIAKTGISSKQLLVFEVHMRLNTKKTKSIVVSRSLTIAPSYGGLTLGSAKLEELNILRNS